MAYPLPHSALTAPATERLAYCCDKLPSLLRQFSEEDFARIPAPGKWSKKQILGHLIDSATNNHHRIIRAQFEEAPQIVYDQDAWNCCGHYQQMDGRQVIAFWEAYNRHLLELINRLPSEALARTCRTNSPEPVTLQWLIDDYVLHLEHHLQQIIPDY